MNISTSGKNLIKQYEGLRLTAYLCPAKVPTIGYGHTGGVKLGDKITQAQADSYFDNDIARFVKSVNSLVENINCTQGQFDALVSFAYNLGVTALGGSTLMAKFRKGDVKGAADEFLRWVNISGKPSAGLAKRRASERAMFLGGE